MLAAARRGRPGWRRRLTVAATGSLLAALAGTVGYLALLRVGSPDGKRVSDNGGSNGEVAIKSERDGRHAVQVTREPSKDATAPPDAGRVRRLAEWTVKNRGSVAVRGQFDGERYAGNVNELPSETFTISRLLLNGSQEKLDDDKLLQLLQDCPPGVMEFSIGNAVVSDAGVKRALGMPCFNGITILSLSGLPVTDDVMSSVLDHKGSLKRLCLGGMSIDADGWKRLQGFENTHLEYLCIAVSAFCDDDLVAVGGLKQLTELWINDTQITNAGLKHLRGMQRLHHLGLFHTAITDAGLESLHGLKELGWVDVRGTQVTASGVRRLRECLPNCTVTADVPDEPAGRKTP